MSGAVEIAGWTLIPDVTRTKELYTGLPPISCACGYCRNLLAAYPVLPDEVRAVFGSLGIDPMKEGGEIFTYTAARDEGMYCGGSLVAVGEVVASPTSTRTPTASSWLPTSR